MNEWKDLLVFNRRERNGILMLTTCIVLFTVVRFFISIFQDEKKLIAKIQSIDLSKEFEAIDQAEKSTNYSMHEVDNAAHFEVNQDSTNQSLPIHFSNTIKSQRREKTEINSADSAALEKLPWIGGKLAARIIKYRNALGGFHSLTQLKDIYGLSSEAYQAIDSLCMVNSSLIHTIHINQDSVQYVFHPYLSKKQWNTIHAFIHKHGPAYNCEYLKQTLVLNDEEIAKLCPYLSFN